MRIRKNLKKLSIDVFSHTQVSTPKVIERHVVCELNQYGWELNSRFEHYFMEGAGEEDSNHVVGNGDSEETHIGALRSDNISYNEGESNEEEHHSNHRHQLNSTCNNNTKEPPTPEQPPRRRGRPRKKTAIASNNSSAEYYYYGGFGPWRSKRRGLQAADNHMVEAKPTSLCDLETFEFANDQEYIEDDYDDDDETNEDYSNGVREIIKKRARKPVKARSLKSLM